MLINVLDYSSSSTDPIQAALDDSLDGDRVYIPGAPFGASWKAPVGGWKIRKGIELFGDGPGQGGSVGGSTCLEPSGSGSNNDVLVIEPSGIVDSVLVHDLRITVLAGPNTSRHGMTISTLSGNVSSVRIERVFVLNMAQDAFHLCAPIDAVIPQLSIVSCYATLNGAVGFSLNRVSSARIVRSTGSNNRRSFSCVDSGVSLYVCGAERDADSGNAAPASCVFSGCAVALLEALRVEDFYVANSSVDRIGILLEGCSAAMVSTAMLIHPDPPPYTTTAPPPAGTRIYQSRGIVVTATPAIDGPTTICPCFYARIVPTLLQVADGAQASSVLPQALNFESTDTSIPAGVIVLPGTDASPTNGGLLAFPWVFRIGNAMPSTSEQRAGVSLPVLDADPEVTVSPLGMIFYRNTADAIGGPGLRIRAQGGWSWIPTY